MSRGTNQKFKFTYLMKIMLEKTDDEHSITMPQIMEFYRTAFLFFPFSLHVSPLALSFFSLIFFLTDLRSFLSISFSRRYFSTPGR